MQDQVSVGPIGTGVHVLRGPPSPSGGVEADVWLTVLFLPVLPLGLWTREASRDSGSGWQVSAAPGPRAWRRVRTIGRHYGVALLTLVPGFLTVRFSEGLVVGLMGLLTSTLAIIGLLGWLDATRERLPLPTAWELLRPGLPPRSSVRG